MANDPPAPTYQISSEEDGVRAEVLDENLDSEEVAAALQSLIDANYLIDNPKRKLVVVLVVNYIEDK